MEQKKKDFFGGGGFRTTPLSERLGFLIGFLFHHVNRVKQVVVTHVNQSKANPKQDRDQDLTPEDQKGTTRKATEKARKGEEKEENEGVENPFFRKLAFFFC